MEAEDLVVDQGGQGQVVEEVGEVFPHVGVAVFSQALVVEPVHLRDLTGLVVPSEDGDALGVTDLKANKESDGFHRVVAPVDIVPCDISQGRPDEWPTYP